MVDLSRREFMLLAGGTGAAFFTGCATNPVTGAKQLMFVSKQSEIELDRKWAPHQFSADYGSVQSRSVNSYVSSVGRKLVCLTHRPDMPYNFRVLNTAVVNGYTFPAGSVGLARGLMIAMENEAQLAAVLGHELAHVNHRHASSQQTKGLLASGAVAVAALYLEYEDSEYAALSAGLGAIGANLLLARYSRDHEREADKTGMEYIARAGYPASGMPGLMEVFRKLEDRKPSVVELLFATHPLTEERYKVCLKRSKEEYESSLDNDNGRERFMDNIAPLRDKADLIRELQDGDFEMKEGHYEKAGDYFRTALRRDPADYAALLLMAKSLLVREKSKEALEFCESAKQAYPSEPQAHHVSGIVKLGSKMYGQAFEEFNQYERLLPGNTNTVFYKGYSLENMGRRRMAAMEYIRYCKEENSGEKYEYAVGRLSTWGYLGGSRTGRAGRQPISG